MSESKVSETKEDVRTETKVDTNLSVVSEEAKTETKEETKEETKHEEPPPSMEAVLRRQNSNSTVLQHRSTSTTSKMRENEEMPKSTEEKLTPQQQYDKWLKTKTLSSDMKEKLNLLFINPLSKKGEYRIPEGIKYEDLAKTLAAIDLYYGNWKKCDHKVYCRDPADDIVKREKRCSCSSEKCIMCGKCIRVCNKNNPTCSCKPKSLAELYLYFYKLSNASFENVEVSESIFKQFSNASQETYFQENTGDKHILTHIRYTDPSKKDESKKQRNTGLEPPPAAVANKKSAQKDASLLNKLVVKKLKSIYLTEVEKLREKLENDDTEGLSDRKFLYKYGLGQLEIYLDTYKRKNMDEVNQKNREKVEASKKEFNSYVKTTIELPIPLLPEKYQGDKPIPMITRHNVDSGITHSTKPRVVENIQLNRWNDLGLKRMHFESKNEDEIDKYKRALAETGANRKEYYKDDVGEVDETLYRLACKKKQERREKEKRMKELSIKYFNEWKGMKEFMEKARFYLERILLEKKDPVFRLKNYNFTDDQDKENKKVMIVAECLKSIDETLKDDFFNWGNVRYSQHLLEAIWDLVPPVSCDFHQISTSTRLLFLKILSPESDFERQLANTFFDKFVKMKIEKKVNPTMIYSILKDGIENQSDIPKEYFVLNHKDFNYFCSLMSIRLNQNEIDRVFRAFDADNSKTISYDEFIDFTGPSGSVSEAMKKKCIWDSACPFCGLSISKDIKGIEMPSHVDRKKNKFICDLHNNKDFETPKKCEKSQCNRKTTSNNMKILRYLSAPQLLKEKLAKTLLTTPKPMPPKVTYRVGDEFEDNTCSCITLNYKPGDKNDVVMFYSIDKLIDAHEFLNVYKDPITPDEDMKNFFVDKGLNCYTKYTYRVTAYNANGKSDYSYINVYPRPERHPLKPMVVRKTAYTVKLNWDVNKDKVDMINRLRYIFDALDEDHSGTLDREELMEGLEKDKKLAEFINSLKISKYGKSKISLDKTEYNNASKTMSESKMSESKLDAGGSTTSKKSEAIPEPKYSLYDVINNDDSDSISWEEFVSFFAINMNVENIPSAAIRNGCMYVLQRCIDDVNNVWRDEYIGKSAEIIVDHLLPSTIYQFRLLIKSADGVSISDPTDYTTVCTLLATPDPPTLSIVGGGVDSRSFRVEWKRYNKFNKPKIEIKTTKLKKPDEEIAKWSNEEEALHPEHHGVHIDQALSKIHDKYMTSNDIMLNNDKNNDGVLDRNEFKILMNEFGLKIDDKEMEELFNKFDEDNNGVITAEEFDNWFKTNAVKYRIRTINRNNDISPEDIVVDENYFTVVSDLIPNTDYDVSIQVFNSFTNSLYSKSIRIHTLSERVECLARIEVLSRSCSIKWKQVNDYNDKYIVEIKAVENRVTNWNVCYEGKLNYCRISNLKPCKDYLIRAKCYNGYYSDSISIKTTESEPIYSDIWNRGFPVECTETSYSDIDIEIGDVILFADEIPNESERIERLIIGRVVNCIYSNGSRVSESTVSRQNSISMNSVTKINSKYSSRRPSSARSEMLLKKSSILSGKSHYVGRIYTIEIIRTKVMKDKYSNDINSYGLAVGSNIDRKASELINYEITRDYWIDEDLRKKTSTDI